jgi:hypothetical protein
LRYLCARARAPYLKSQGERERKGEKREKNEEEKKEKQKCCPPRKESVNFTGKGDLSADEATG